MIVRFCRGASQMCKRIDYVAMREVLSNRDEHRALDRGLWTLRQAIAGAGFEPC
jgi:hypothetical protein